MFSTALYSMYSCRGLLESAAGASTHNDSSWLSGKWILLA